MITELKFGSPAIFSTERMRAQIQTLTSLSSAHCTVGYGSVRGRVYTLARAQLKLSGWTRTTPVKLSTVSDHLYILVDGDLDIPIRVRVRGPSMGISSIFSVPYTVARLSYTSVCWRWVWSAISVIWSA